MKNIKENYSVVELDNNTLVEVNGGTCLEAAFYAESKFSWWDAILGPGVGAARKLIRISGLYAGCKSV